jgi:hypothetical protein
VLEGDVVNVNKHSVQGFVRVLSGTSQWAWTSGALLGASTSSAAYAEINVSDLTPPATNSRIMLVVPAGSRARLILPGLYESPIAPPSPIIGDDTAAAQTMSETVTSTPIAETFLTPEFGVGVWVGVPYRAGQAAYLTASHVANANYTAVILNATTVTMRKFVNSSSEQAIISYTHAEDEEMVVIYGWDGSIVKISAIAAGGILPTPASDTSTSDAPLSSTLETGSKNGALSFQGEILFNGTFSSFDQAKSFIEANGWADTSNL